MNELTKSNEYSLRIDLQTFQDARGAAVYSHFRIDNASKLFRIDVSGFVGDIGEKIFCCPNNRMFSSHCISQLKFA